MARRQAAALAWHSRWSSNQAPVYSAPTGFGILQPTHGGDGLPAYGYSANNSNWNIAQWNNNQPLSPFALTGPQEWTATCDSAQAQIALANDVFRASLSQSAGNIPCKTSAGQLNEFDLFVTPNIGNSNKSESSAFLGNINPSEAASLILAICRP